MNDVVYIDPVEWRERPVGGHNGRGEDGRGSKICTTNQVLIKGKWYRVYATCTSSSTGDDYWVVVGGKKYHLTGKE